MNRHNNPNWGNHGNPNRTEWYHYTRNYQRSDVDTNSYSNHTSPWLVVWIIVAVFILSGFSDTARGIIFYGINITETWYASVDNMLDALGAPKLP